MALAADAVVSTPIAMRVPAQPTLPSRPSVGRVVHYYPEGPHFLRDADGGVSEDEGQCDRPLLAFVCDTRAEEAALPDDMTVNLDVRGSSRWAAVVGIEVPYSETPTPGTHRWCWPPRI